MAAVRITLHSWAVATLKDQAVCIRLLDWSETSQIVVLMTQRHGKVSATAKGAKRQQPSSMAKFSGGVELLTAGEAVLIVKRSAELANLIEWDLTEAHWHLRRDLGAYRLAMYAVDLTHHMVRDHDPHPRTYRALLRFLGELADPSQQAAALLRFQWAVVEDMGYRPVLDRDAATGRPLSESAAMVGFSPTAGGVVREGGGGAPPWRVRRRTVELLRCVAAGGDVRGAERRSVDGANRLLCAYFRAILDRELPTMGAVLGRGKDKP